MTLKCDVLVVGAGPAGSSAARAAAISGAKTIFIDKKKEIGVPVQCAESISKYLIPLLPFKIPSEQLLWKTEGVQFWADDSLVEKTGDFWSACAVNRKNFDRWLAQTAVDAGAKLLTSAELVDLKVINEEVIENAVVKTLEGEKVIDPKVVIAADGVKSTVLNCLPIAVKEEGNIGHILSFEMKNLILEKPQLDQLFIGDFAPGTYGYIFPKSGTAANVGVGTLFSKEKLDEKYLEFLEIPHVKKQLRDGINVRSKSGSVPFRCITDSWVYGNTLLVGDSAAQNIKPFVEGILPGIICGDIAGQVAAQHIKSDMPLSNYVKNVQDKLGDIFKESNRIADIMYDLSLIKDRKQHLLRLGVSANVFSLNDIDRLKNEDYITLKKRFEAENKN